jgi:asparagine synthase (glutamine-hydrolysing)
MCGICGFALSDKSPRTVDRTMLARMSDAIAHRGPDGSGVYVDGRVALGHRRLSIIDVAGGQQPMASDDGSLQLIYNGEVFNHADLRAGLEQRGQRYHTRCDTETVLRMYALEGADTPRFLRGMFAFAIWDARKRELFLARDRFGVKPLYYALTEDGSLFFGSEIKAILASRAINPALNLSTLPDYLANYAPSGEETMFAGIRRLPPGHTLRWKDGRVTITRYWDLHFESSVPESASDGDVVADYRERLSNAIRMRLMSDVPLGMFLSGGIDSAAITALMSGMVDAPIKTFSVAFAERDANELHYARLVAERFKTDHREIVITPEQFFGALPKLVWHEDEPIAHPSSIALNFVSRLAAEHVKVVLTGEGSDETLAGYNRYRVTVVNQAFGARYERLAPRAVRAAVRRGIESMPSRARVRQRLTRSFLYVPSDLDTLYFDNFAVFSRRRQAELLSPRVQRDLAGTDPYFAHHAALERTDATSLLNRLLYADTATYLHELLMKQDQMSMAASIESRVPFLDHPLVEFVAGLPQRFKLRGWTTKWILREAMRGRLPAEILSRRKMGFPVPIGAWFRGPYRGVVDEFVTADRVLDRGLFAPAEVRRLVAAHMSGDENHAQRLWALINLEIWQRTFVDGESIADVRVA